MLSRQCIEANFQFLLLKTKFFEFLFFLGEIFSENYKLLSQEPLLQQVSHTSKNRASERVIGWLSVRLTLDKGSGATADRHIYRQTQTHKTLVSKETVGSASV